MANLTVLGAGAWGSAVANLASDNGHEVSVWSRSSSLNLESVLIEADVVVSAVSMKGVVETVERIKRIKLNANAIIVTATKGLDPVTTCTPSRIWRDAFPERSIVVLSGPNLSQEIVQGLPTATVAASLDLEAAKRIQDIYNSETFRVYINSDPLGTELGGTLKNVFAIAAGVCDGLHLGTNAKSALLTRALPEMIRVGVRLGAQVETFYGLSGLGDLLATCNSALSRNYRVGYGLAQGKSLEQVLQELKSTAEGVNTTNVLIDLAKKQGIEVPVSTQVYRLINGIITPEQAVAALMERTVKPEKSS
ncbi:NAD(P)H-dependent glycerol-3-phosphate dehydrogenase [Kamptonema sp. UHCC 0994]|uniref:NAD(P)H-dependent glycerol-3-phosphate dehydrogenase n=1 Tax=Kamptonema sp. UHCC 0994 TaxID=3031329 RepID=UPI0023B8BB6C|nr:NAD(P)H-dependent glycerol-3-phosphate dehydrogenase [Kamptonema sp. UHCC 0994]MDF0555834.1 NAD(P)H-dependent glycerol-3-phosphate dehydrogenase [Kamptonema sp. UHCC 0994]